MRGWLARPSTTALIADIVRDFAAIDRALQIGNHIAQPDQRLEAAPLTALQGRERGVIQER